MNTLYLNNCRTTWSHGHQRQVRSLGDLCVVNLQNYFVQIICDETRDIYDRVIQQVTTQSLHAKTVVWRASIPYRYQSSSIKTSILKTSLLLTTNLFLLSLLRC